MKNKKPKIINSNFLPAQVMLLSLLIMGGVMAVAMAVNLVILNEIKIARQTPESVKALAAADTGIECSLYQYFVVGNRCGSVCSSSQVLMTSGTQFNSVISCGSSTTSRATGISGGVRRSLEAIIPL